MNKDQLDNAAAPRSVDQQQTCSALEVGYSISVNFRGGIEGGTTGVVINPNKGGYVQFRCNCAWHDPLGNDFHKAGTIHLAHLSEVTQNASDQATAS